MRREIAKTLNGVSRCEKLPKAAKREFGLSTEQRQNLTAGSRCRLDRTKKGTTDIESSREIPPKFRRPNWAVIGCFHKVPHRFCNDTIYVDIRLKNLNVDYLKKPLDALKRDRAAIGSPDRRPR